jgi:hypothetical protein
MISSQRLAVGALGVVLGHWTRGPGELADKVRMLAFGVGTGGVLLGAVVLVGQTAVIPIVAAGTVAGASAVVTLLAMRAPRPRGEPFKRTVFAGISLFALVRIIVMLDGVRSAGPDPRIVSLCVAWLACMGIIALGTSLRARRSHARSSAPINFGDDR